MALDGRIGAQIARLLDESGEPKANRMERGRLAEGTTSLEKAGKLLKTLRSLASAMDDGWRYRLARVEKQYEAACRLDESTVDALDEAVARDRLRRAVAAVVAAEPSFGYLVHLDHPGEISSAIAEAFARRGVNLPVAQQARRELIGAAASEFETSDDIWLAAAALCRWAACELQRDALSSVEVVHGRQITLDEMEATCRLDRDLYGPSVGSIPQRGLDWLHVCPEAIHVARSERHKIVLGYVTALPLPWKVIQRISASGRDTIPAADVVAFTAEQQHYVYVVSVAVRHDCDHSTVLEALHSAFVASMRDVSARGCRIHAFYAARDSNGGAHLLETYGFRPCNILSASWRPFFELTATNYRLTPQGNALRGAAFAVSSG